MRQAILAILARKRFPFEKGLRQGSQELFFYLKRKYRNRKQTCYLHNLYFCPHVAIVFCTDSGGWGESTRKLLPKIHQYLCNRTTYECFVCFSSKLKSPSSKRHLHFEKSSRKSLRYGLSKVLQNRHFERCLFTLRDPAPLRRKDRRSQFSAMLASLANLASYRNQDLQICLGFGDGTPSTSALSVLTETHSFFLRSSGNGCICY